LIPFSYDLFFKIKHIQKSLKFPKVSFTCICDVRNTFKGINGAIPIFGPQKGLKPKEIPLFKDQSDFLIDLMYHKNKLVFEDRTGFGAAGGVAVGLSAFFETKVEIGAKYFFEKTLLKEKIISSDLIITGEGKYDNQSKSGKACYELLQLAKKNNKRILLITSGNEADQDEFSEVLIIPDLDFKKHGFKERAKKNLQELVNKIELK